jgi:hypothetical protein
VDDWRNGAASAPCAVDEVYLEMLFDPVPPSAFSLGRHVHRDQQPDETYGSAGCGAVGSWARQNWLGTGD